MSRRARLLMPLCAALMLGLGAILASAQTGTSITFTCTTGPLATVAGSTLGTAANPLVLTGFNLARANTVPINSGAGAGRPTYDPVSITFALTEASQLFLVAGEESSSPSACSLTVMHPSSGLASETFTFPGLIPTQVTISDTQSSPVQSLLGLAPGLQGTITFNYSELAITYVVSPSS